MAEEVRELVFEVVQARTELRLLDLLEVELRAEAIVLVFKVGDPAADVRRARPDGGRDTRLALGAGLAQRRGGRMRRGGANGNNGFSAQLCFELCDSSLEEGRVLLLAVARGLSGVCARAHKVSLQRGGSG